MVFIEVALPGQEEWGSALMMAAALFTALVLPYTIFKRLQREGQLEA